MFEAIQKTIKLKAALIFLLIHVGLVTAVYCVARLSGSMGMDQTLGFLLAGILILYFGILLGIYFVMAPLIPWIRRTQQVSHWTDRLLKDLPTLVENLPKIIDAVRTILALWHEYKNKPVPTTPPATTQQKP